MPNGLVNFADFGDLRYSLIKLVNLPEVIAMKEEGERLAPPMNR